MCSPQAIVNVHQVERGKITCEMHHVVQNAFRLHTRTLNNKIKRQETVSGIDVEISWKGYQTGISYLSHIFTNQHSVMLQRRRSVRQKQLAIHLYIFNLAFS